MFVVRDHKLLLYYIIQSHCGRSKSEPAAGVLAVPSQRLRKRGESAKYATMLHFDDDEYVWNPQEAVTTLRGQGHYNHHAVIVLSIYTHISI